MAVDTTHFKINGQTFAELGISEPRLRGVNGAPDVFSWRDPLTRFDAALRWPYDTEIVLTAGGEVVFRGKVRKTPRFLGATAESIAYEAHGPWAWLNEQAYLQEHRFVDDPEAEEPTFTPKEHGRAVLGLKLKEDGTSEHVQLGEALAEIVSTSGAGVTVGSITGFDFQVPLDEAVDLQVTDAMGRLLQWAPDAAEWYGYAASPPTYNVGRRADLEEVTLAVPAPGEGGTEPFVPFESIALDPAYKLQAPAVVIFFRRATDATNGVWAVHEKQAAPEGATGREPRAIVRTIDLAGAVPGGGRLTQPVKTESLSALLQTAGTVLPATGEAGNAFNALAAFWRRKVPRLRNATINAFQACTRVRVPDGSEDKNQSTAPTAVCIRELTRGGITDWMLEQQASLRVETQVISCRVLFTEVVDGVSTVRVENYTTRVTATNAVTKAYRSRGGVVEVGEEAEAAMPGLAAKIWQGVKDLHYDGTFVIVEERPTLTVRPGKVVNLDCAARPEWANMRALVQMVDADLATGRTVVTVGPPHHLGPQELQELFRSNRSRKDVLSADVRVAGRYS